LRTSHQQAQLVFRDALVVVGLDAWGGGEGGREGGKDKGGSESTASILSNKLIKGINK